MDTTIKVSSRAMTALRFGAWSMILCVVILLGPISECCSDFDERTSLGTWLKFYSIVGIFLTAFLLWAFVLWRRVPPDAKNGYIKIDDTSIFYKIGSYHRDVTLSEIVHAEPVVFPQGKYPAALWLSFKQDGPRPGSQRAVLQRKIRKKPATPVEGDAWLVLPIVLFARDEAVRIVELVQSQVSAARQNTS